MEGPIDFNAFKERRRKEGAPTLPPPPDTFEIHKEYDFDPPVPSSAYWDRERTVGNMIGQRLFAKGRCEKYLEMTGDGPLILFSGKLTAEPKISLNDTVVYFGIIYNKTDPERSHAV